MTFGLTSCYSYGDSNPTISESRVSVSPTPTPVAAPTVTSSVKVSYQLGRQALSLTGTDKTTWIAFAASPSQEEKGWGRILGIDLAGKQVDEDNVGGFPLSLAMQGNTIWSVFGTGDDSVVVSPNQVITFDLNVDLQTIVKLNNPVSVLPTDSAVWVLHQAASNKIAISQVASSSSKPIETIELPEGDMPASDFGVTSCADGSLAIAAMTAGTPGSIKIFTASSNGSSEIVSLPNAASASLSCTGNTLRLLITEASGITLATVDCGSGALTGKVTVAGASGFLLSGQSDTWLIARSEDGSPKIYAVADENSLSLPQSISGTLQTAAIIADQLAVITMDSEHSWTVTRLKQ